MMFPSNPSPQTSGKTTEDGAKGVYESEEMEKTRTRPSKLAKQKSYEFTETEASRPGSSQFFITLCDYTMAFCLVFLWDF